MTGWLGLSSNYLSIGDPVLSNWSCAWLYLQFLWEFYVSSHNIKLYIYRTDSAFKYSWFFIFYLVSFIYLYLRSLWICPWGLLTLTPAAYRFTLVSSSLLQWPLQYFWKGNHLRKFCIMTIFFTTTSHSYIPIMNRDFYIFIFQCIDHTGNFLHMNYNFPISSFHRGILPAIDLIGDSAIVGVSITLSSLFVESLQFQE